MVKSRPPRDEARQREILRLWVEADHGNYRHLDDRPNEHCLKTEWAFLYVMAGPRFVGMLGLRWGAAILRNPNPNFMQFVSSGAQLLKEYARQCGLAVHDLNTRQLNRISALITPGSGKPLKNNVMRLHKEATALGLPIYQPGSDYMATYARLENFFDQKNRYRYALTKTLDQYEQDQTTGPIRFFMTEDEAVLELMKTQQGRVVEL